MAISSVMLDVVRQICTGRIGVRIASMGYPDILMPLDEVAKLLGARMGDLKYSSNSAGVCRRHNIPERQIPDSESLFALMGAELHVYDIVQERGCEILCDLNYPLKVTLPYDVVLDVGTAEHCFNIAQAMMNMAWLVALDGIIIHENPFNYSNHGFYNLNPTLYHDFYTVNGFEVMDIRLFDSQGGSIHIPHTKRFKCVQEEAGIFAMARRKKVVPLQYPVQAKYAKAIKQREAA